MKFIFGFFGFVAVAALAVWYFVIRKPATAGGVNNSGTTANTNSAGGFASWFPGWNGFTTQSLNSVTGSVTSALTDLKSISNLFGSNNGGTNPGVSISGSSIGGTQSAGSGAGLPSNFDFYDFGGSVPNSSLYDTGVGLNGNGNTSDYSLWGF